MTDSLGTLYYIDANSKSRVIRAVAAIANIPFNGPAPGTYTHFTTNKTEEYKSKFVNGKIPAWEGKDGFILFEGVAIARYFAGKAPESGLLGNSPEDAAKIDQWIHFTESEVDSPTLLMMQLLSGNIAYSKAVHTHYAAHQLKHLGILNDHLATRTYLVTERVTLADIWLAMIVQRAGQVTLDAPARAKLPHVIRHFETIANHPKIKDITGEIKYLEKALVYAPKK